MAKVSTKRLTKQNIIDQLVKNNVLLQQKSTELITSMSNLNKNIEKLVQIFQKAAESMGKGEIKEPLTFKLSQLIDQNKQIARGLLLLEQYIKQRIPPGPSKVQSNEF